MSASLIQNDFDFEKASKLLNVMIDPRSSDDGSPVVGQQWFNTTSKRVKGYDGTTVFSLMRLDGTDTYTGIITFNPASGSVPFAVDATKNGVVTNLNSDRVDGYHVAEAATVSTIAARDASGNITVATPTSDGHAATKAYVDSIAAGQDWKDSCLVATTANITLSGTQVIDGVSVPEGARVLVKNQTTPSENGLYTCAAGAWSRTADSDENAEVTSGLTTYIEQGTENAGAGYTLTTSGTIVVGTTGLIFTRTSGGSVYSAGNGIVKAGTTFHFAQAASYTIGALPYADGSSTIGFISAVASGKVLKSNGENTVPIWAAVDLTADVTGTLPVGKGGTGTETQFTQGSVIFAGASGVYSQDNAGLFFDAVNNRLGINTATPGATLDVAGNILLSNGAARSITGPTGDDLKMISAPDAATEGIKWYVDGGTTPGMVLLQTGKLGIGGGIVPAELVHLYTGAAEDIKLRMDSDSTGSAYLEIDRQTTGAKAGIILQDGSTTKWTFGDLNGNNSFVFDSASVSDALVIFQNGTTHIGSPIDLWNTIGPDSVNFARETEFGGSASYKVLQIGEAGVTRAISIGADVSANLSLAFTGNEVIFPVDRNIITPNVANNAYLGLFGIDASEVLHIGASGYNVKGGGIIRIDLSTSEVGLGANPVLGKALHINGALSISSSTLVTNLNADLLDGYHAADLLDLVNSTGDTDDISEGLTNLFYTDARARAALSSAASAEIDYNSTTGVIGLGTEAGRVKSGTIGDGTSTSLTFTHNLGTRDVIVQVFQTGTPYKTVFCGITRNTTNQVTLDFSTAPAAGSRTVVVTAANG